MTKKYKIEDSFDYIINNVKYLSEVDFLILTDIIRYNTLHGYISAERWNDLINKSKILLLHYYVRKE